MRITHISILLSNYNMNGIAHSGNFYCNNTTRFIYFDFCIYKKMKFSTRSIPQMVFSTRSIPQMVFSVLFIIVSFFYNLFERFMQLFHQCKKKQTTNIHIYACAYVCAVSFSHTHTHTHICNFYVMNAFTCKIYWFIYKCMCSSFLWYICTWIYEYFWLYIYIYIYIYIYAFSIHDPIMPEDINCLKRFRS